jgi:hypothetical protein
MILTRIRITATTRRIWMNPPSVNEVRSPTSHKTMSTTAIIHSIIDQPFFFQFAGLALLSGGKGAEYEVQCFVNAGKY